MYTTAGGAATLLQEGYARGRPSCSSSSLRHTLGSLVVDSDLLRRSGGHLGGQWIHGWPRLGRTLSRRRLLRPSTPLGRHGPCRFMAFICASLRALQRAMCRLRAPDLRWDRPAWRARPARHPRHTTHFSLAVLERGWLPHAARACRSAWARSRIVSRGGHRCFLAAMALSPRVRPRPARAAPSRRHTVLHVRSPRTP